MADDVPKIIQEILDLTGDTQTKLGRKLGVGQSTIWRWLNRENTPNKDQWDRIQALWMDLKGIQLSIDAKLAPYDDATRETVHRMVDDYLRHIPKRRA